MNFHIIKKALQRSSFTFLFLPAFLGGLLPVHSGRSMEWEGVKDGLTDATARIQAIHNVADPDMGMVDVYIDGERVANDLVFREATTFREVAAGREITITIAKANSTSPADSIKQLKLTLEPDGVYTVVGAGVLDPDGFAPNPDARDIYFNIFKMADVHQEAVEKGSVDLLAFHGSTDAPGIDIRIRGKEEALFPGLKYGDFSSYATLTPGTFIFDLALEGDPEGVLASFRADLSDLAGKSGIIFSSGFLSPEDNREGALFGLFIAFSDGNVMEIPQLTTARLQLIHNSADPDAQAVDIYLNGEKAVEGLMFRTATSFREVRAGNAISVGETGNLTIAVAPAGSKDPDEALKSVTFGLLPDETYIAVIGGLINSAGFAPNPDERSTDMNIDLQKSVSAGTPADQVSLLLHHGATDAPGIDIGVAGLGKVIRDLRYQDFEGPLTVPAGIYEFFLTEKDSSAVLRSYVADISDYGGSGLTILASGFLYPEKNQDGVKFSLIGVDTSGNVLEFISTAIDPVTGLENPVILLQNQPNPFHTTTTIPFELDAGAFVTLKVYNQQGQVLQTLVDDRLSPGVYRFSFYADGLPSGIYYYRLQVGEEYLTRKMVKF